MHTRGTWYNHPHRSVTSRAALAVVVAALLVVATSCVFGNNGDRVGVFGDSITSLDDGLRASLSSFNVEQAGYFGYTTEQVMEPADELASKNLDQLIMNIGSNDVIQQLPINEVELRLRALVDKFPDVDCLHLVTINESMFEAEEFESRAGEAQAANAVIRAIADEVDRVHLIDWNEVVAGTLQGNPPTSSLTTDSVHPNAEGYVRLHDIYKDALGSCGNLLIFE